MIIEQAIQNKLRDSAEVKSLIDTRVYVGTLPQTVVYPCVSIVQISNAVSYTHRYDISRLQLTVTAGTYPESKSVSDALINVLNSFEGILSGVTVGSIGIDNIVNARDQKHFYFILDIIVRYINN